MRRLNHHVQLEGWKPSDVARRFLIESTLVAADDVPGRSRLALELAVSKRDTFAASQTRAVLAVRRVFPERPVHVSVHADPIAEVARGGAKLALLGAERFFRRGPAGLDRVREVEAVAVVGSRMAHLLTRDASGGLSGRIGVGPPKSGSALIGAALVHAAGGRVASSLPHTGLVEALRSGQLDAAIIVLPVGSELVSTALTSGELHLRPLTGLLLDEAPFLRRSRIPAKTYPHHGAPIDTLSSQVVLAGPSRQPHATGLKGGPAAALLVEAKPISVEQAELLAEAAGAAELPDPVLPAAHHVALEGSDADDHALGDTLLNVLMWIFLAWLVSLLARPDARSSTGAASRKP